MAELKPCKCKNRKKPEYFIKPFSDHIEYIYVCQKCKHYGIGFSDEAAVDDWNKRN